jgi:hypothetical protein
MKITPDLIVVTLVTITLAVWFSVRLHWSLGAMMIAGLAWSVIDDKLMSPRS